MSAAPAGLVGRLRRDLGTLESYAGMIGTLIGAGIFRVTSDAWALTGPSILLGEVLLALLVLATMVPYAAYLSSPLGELPGGEYTHLRHTFGGLRLAFIAAWLKIISYVGAAAFLARVLADYLGELGRTLGSAALAGPGARTAVGLLVLLFFYGVHTLGVRWFGRVQVTLCAILGVSILVLVVPGLPAIQPRNYQPFFSHGARGFLASLPPLFFQFAGFEAMIHSAGEVQASTQVLPRVLLRGLLATTVIYLLMSLVSLGVLPAERLLQSPAPMAEVAAVYLPRAAAAIVSIGALMAVSTSLNSSVLVPSRLVVMLAEDGLVPRWLGQVSPTTGVPTLALTLTQGVAAIMLISGQISLALNIAVMALVLLYFLHTLAFLLLPRRNPALGARIKLRIAGVAGRAAPWLALLALGVLLLVQLESDVTHVLATTLGERWRKQSLTSLELGLAWGAVGVGLGMLARRRLGGWTTVVR